MNANELADIVDKWDYKESAEYLTDAANMLRQQADRIRNLEKTLGFKNSGYETINLTPPVAWMYNYENFPDSFVVCRARKSDQDIPLYTHPVKEQDESFDRTASHMAGEYVAYKAELTDEEIRTIQAICHLKNVGYDNFIMRFARAILKKAQNG